MSTAILTLLAILLAIALGGAFGVMFASSRFARNKPEAAPPQQDPAGAFSRLETLLRESSLQREHTLGGLEQHLTALSRETVALSQALRAPQARGRWGELTLRRVAELAGMAPYCDFQEQESSGGLRPDMMVRLPGNRTLAVDAKAPLSAYLDAQAAPDDASRIEALVRHAQQVWRHVTLLSAREYWSALQPSPEMVVLFLPGDHFLSAALERDPELLERALSRKVILATPVTLISVLKGVAYTWRQEQLAKNAEELRRIAAEFQDRVRAYAEFYADSGRQLAKAVDAYNRSVASWEARLQPSLRRMRELGVGSPAAAPEPVRIESAVREPQPLRVDRIA